MNGININLPRRERGAILVIALVFLVAITLLTLSSMRSSNINLHMAQNEESRVAAIQAAQALSDAIIANPQSTPVVGSSGYTSSGPAAELAMLIGTGAVVSFTMGYALLAWWPKKRPRDDEHG